MASGTLVEGGVADGAIEKTNRWIENKVYTRKVFRKGIKKNDSSQPPPSSTQTVVDVADSHDPPPPAEETTCSVQTSESHVNINLSRMSKEEIREVKLKLVDELEQVRDLLKQVEAKEVELTGIGDSHLSANDVVDTTYDVVDANNHIIVDDDNDGERMVHVVDDEGDGERVISEVHLDNGGVVGVRDDGGGNMICEVNFDNGDTRSMVPDVSYGNGVGRRMIPEGSFESGGGRRLNPEVSYDNSAGRRMIPEGSYESGGGGRRMVSEVNLDTGSTRRMVPEFSLDDDVRGERRMISEVNLENGGSRRAIPEVNSLGKREPPRSLHQLRVSVMENSFGGMTEYVEKEKRTPKANQFYRNSDFIVGKEKLPHPNKKPKLNGSKKHGRDRDYGFALIKHTSQVFKNSSSLLAKLMKHKHGWVFNSPVDVEGLGLHDYFLIIKHPMDLGTVKTRLNANWYQSPREFAEDVRLTFRNAMTYNPKGQDVHVMAEQLSHIFEERWAVMEIEFNLDSWFELYHNVGLPSHMMSRAPRMPLPEMGRNLDRLESTPQHVMPKPMNYGSFGRSTSLKKPKAKDQNKRDMTYEEKQKLSTNLQNLPSEKLDNIVEIIKKRNASVIQQDDAIEVDIDCVDAETLWELDRFVTNYKKSLSKYKRRAELAMQAKQQAERIAQARKQALEMADVSKENKTDERNTGLSPPIQTDKQQDNGSRSSSSSSSSSDSGSSSSDSDSDSSSESGAGNSPRN